LSDHGKAFRPGDEVIRRRPGQVPALHTVLMVDTTAHLNEVLLSCDGGWVNSRDLELFREAEW
jgi:hypothetical protein